MSNDKGAFMANADTAVDFSADERTNTESVSFVGTYSDNKWSMISTH